MFESSHFHQNLAQHCILQVDKNVGDMNV